MWVSKEMMQTVVDLHGAIERSEGKVHRLEIENSRLRSDMDWFKHRLNQVEMERAMLMQDRLGVKISVPQFVPATDQSDEQAAMHSMPDLSTIGGDAKDDGGPLPGVDANPGIDYSLMPGYRGK